MPALSAARCNRQMKEAYRRICGKHPDAKMISVTAVMRRLLLLIYTLWKNGEEYDETRDKTHMPKKKEPECEYGPDDCIRPNSEPMDRDAADEDGNPIF